MAQPLDVLMRKRSSIKGSFTKLRAYVGNLSTTTARLDEIRVRLKHTEQLFQEFNEVEEKIYALNAEDQSQYDSIEQIYYELIAGLSEWERTTSITIGVIDTQMNESGVRMVSPEVKLPGLRVPKFNGQYTEWQTFYQLFTTTIHNSANLHPVQKFQFLVNSLGEEPARLIRHMDITEANYILALNKLKERYDRKRHIVNKFIQMFLEQPSIAKPSAHSLRNMYDVSDEVVRALQGLGSEAKERDVWLLYILVTKIDDTTRTLWMQHSVEQDYPSLETFLKFITNRADALEYQSKSEEQTRVPKINTGIKSQPIKSLLTVSTSCPICNTNNHQMYQCQLFQKMEIPKRIEVIKSSNRCFNCLGADHTVRECRSRRSCQICRRRHHSLIHQIDQNSSKFQNTVDRTGTNQPTTHSQRDEDKTDRSKEIQVKATTVEVPNASPQLVMSMSCAETSLTMSVLPTALIKVQDCTGQWQLCRALLDSGAESSFISEHCVQRLGLIRKEANMTVMGLGGQRVGQTRGSTHFQLKPHFASEFVLSIQAYIAPTITTIRPPRTFNHEFLDKLKNEMLADPSPTNSARVDILIGVDHFWSLLLDGQLRNENKIIAQNSKLGWIVTGTASKSQVASVMSITIEENIEKALSRFWETEEIFPDSRDENTIEHNICEQHYLSSYTRAGDGRYIVKLPFVEAHESLGESYSNAKTRHLAMERKFKRDPQFHQLYKSFMKEYIDLQHMSLIKNRGSEFAVYLPHHGVIKETSTTTKLRVVFDASARTSSGISLNNTLMVGPTVQDTLYHILIKFRKHSIVFGADIEKMYRQIWIHPSDRKYQRILWRETDEHPIDIYELNTVTYGMAPSPYLATRTLQLIADENESMYPEAARAIKENMYVDDVLSGADSVEEAMRICGEIVKLLNQAGMKLRKWSSNSAELLTKFNENVRSETSISFNQPECSTQILGLKWRPKADHFIYQINLDAIPTFTKRRVLSEFSRIFDPLGLLSPFTVRVKMMFQELWMLKLPWDDPMPPEARKRWSKLHEEVAQLQSIAIPRWIGQFNENSLLHGFSDASEKAYAAAVYLVTNANGIRECRLITGKTKVAPVHTVSLPKLELCGALLVAELMRHVGRILDIPEDRMYAWTDSRIVLDWLSDVPQRWKVYVANRTSKILKLIPRERWFHVPSASNSADCATRGLAPDELQQHRLWWHGPDFLLSSQENWPKIDKKHKFESIERRKQIVALTCQQNLLEKFIYELQEGYSSFNKFIMVFAYVCRAINIWTKKPEPKIQGLLTKQEMSETTERVIKAMQNKYFNVEIQRLTSDKLIPNGSQLTTLNPIIDEVGILRVGGRIENAPITTDQRHPIILPSHDPIVKKLIVEIHINNFHCGPSFLFHTIRQRYWIIGVRKTIQGILRQCVPCIKQKPNLIQQKMGVLPRERIELVKPFQRTGLDFFGPLQTYLIHGRGQRSRKSYGCVFVCMCTKALHIEIVTDLTTDAFIGAFDRFVARRGPVTDVYSDNGSNFRGAKRKFDELNQFVTKNADRLEYSLLKKHQLTWHFIPAYAPHFGGLWEAGVKSIKTHLQKVTGNKILSMEELQTLLVQVEAMLNNRPLYISGPEVQDVLTPAHFLLGTRWVALPTLETSTIPYNRLSHWQAVQKMLQILWLRWYKEYVHTLQQRWKWKTNEANLSIGQIVLIKDDNPLLNCWRMGKISQLHPGTDGKVRLVTLKTMDGEIQRVIHKLCPLPVQ